MAAHQNSCSKSGFKKGKLDVSYLLNTPSPQPANNASPSIPSRGLTLHPSAHASSHRNTIGQGGNKCHLCHRMFAQTADLRKHLRTVHEGLRPFQCDLCNKSFGEKGNLYKHRKSVHLNQRPFQCPVCGSSFAFKDGLARHVKLVHENVRPFCCQNCGASYKQISQLRRHDTICKTKSSTTR